VRGQGAAAWLDSLFANKLPQKVGRIALCHLLSANGGVRSEFTVYRRGPEDFYLVSAGALERHDWEQLRRRMPRDGSVELQKVTTQHGVLVVAGPRARALLQDVTDADLSSAAFPWLSGRQVDIGHAQALALRVNFVGELGWELHHPIEMQNTIFDILAEAGRRHELRPFGIRAMDSMRLEKSYRLLPRELSIEYAALESGLERFVQPAKGDFFGRDALLAWQARGFANRFATLEVHGVTDADARGSEPIRRGGEMVGRCTSGGFGWRVGKSLALAMLRPDCAAEGTELEVTILGRPHRATVIAESPWDPRNERLRA
jgi:dimethylglycine dehydrogenase